jgi:ABC-2 type transport system permease protein
MRGRAFAGFWLPLATLWRRELVRFVRERSRLTGSLGTPILFWLLFGHGFGGSFRPPGASGPAGDALVWFFPGTVALLLVFASVFASISLIEDRHEGFLQAVLVAPVSRAAVVLGKVLGGATTAFLEAGLLLVLARAGGLEVGRASWGSVLSAMALLAVGLTAFGFCFAWVVDSVSGFHGIMNLVLLPLWLLSGALFPVEGAPRALRMALAVDPLAYGLALLRHGLDVATPNLPPPAASWGVTGLFAAASLTVAVVLVSRPRAR